MTSLAQPELNVPIRPIIFSFSAYALAFDEHFAESQLPACAVESSQDWKPILISPTFQSRCLSANSTASAISVVSERFAPWSGKSEAINASGSPSPSYRIGPQEADGSAVALPPPPPSSPPQPTAARPRTAMSKTRKPSNPRCFKLRHLHRRIRRCGRRGRRRSALRRENIRSTGLGRKRQVHGGNHVSPVSPLLRLPESRNGGGRVNRPPRRKTAMPKAGVDPARPEGHRILSPARLPVPPLRPA